MMMRLASATIGLFDDVDSPIFLPRNWRPELRPAVWPIFVDAENGFT